eukprot:15247634-Alexandrium_andersonii.AAC.1
MRQGAKLAKAIAAGRFPLDKRVSLVRGELLPLALYGVAGAPCSKKALGALRASIAPIIEPKLAGAR